MSDGQAYVAPATARSTILLLVKQDRIRVKTLTETIMMDNLEVKLSTALQRMTGARMSSMMSSVRSPRVNRVVRSRR